MGSRIGRRVAVYGDCGGWERLACGEDTEGRWWLLYGMGGEQRGCIGSEKWGENRGKEEDFSSLFLFSVRWLGVGAME